MENHGILVDALIFLTAAVVSVPVAKRIGLGSVLGYLVAGAAVGPWGMGFISNAEDILHFAEFGVVLLLFLIGLELNPRRLWDMRKPIIGMGSAQVMGTAAVIAAACMAAGVDWPTALVASMGLALSSTAIALQILTEKNLLSTRAGNSGFGILLFQDIAVIPMLAVLPLLSAAHPSPDESNPLLATAKVAAVVVLIIVGGRYLTRPLFRAIAETRLREIFTAFSLLLVIGIALLMQAVEMSMALGAFLAGVLLAESEYRHQLEADIEPFKGLLLGLFFISVGMSIDFGLLLESPWLILGLLLALVAIKTAVLFILGRIFRLPSSQTPFFTFLLSQAGEFGFVLFSIAGAGGVISSQAQAILIAVVALSMMTTPLLLLLNEAFIEPRFATLEQPPAEEIVTDDNPVIVAGFGRFGQIVARLLHANKIPTTIIDHNPEHIERVRRFGFRVFYGDASRSELLHAAGAEKAKLLVLALDDRAAMRATIENAKINFPHLQILARAWDMLHAHELLDLGVTLFARETFDSALGLGEQCLRELDWGAYQARRAALKFCRHDEETLKRLHEVHRDEDQFVSRTQEALREMERLFEADEQALEKHHRSDWG